MSQRLKRNTPALGCLPSREAATRRTRKQFAGGCVRGSCPEPVALRRRLSSRGQGRAGPGSLVSSLTLCDPSRGSHSPFTQGADPHPVTPATPRGPFRPGAQDSNFPSFPLLPAPTQKGCHWAARGTKVGSRGHGRRHGYAGFPNKVHWSDWFLGSPTDPSKEQV